MPEPSKSEKIQAFYRDLCLGFVGCLKALSLYPEDHPETKKRLNGFFQRLGKYLEQRPTLTLLFVNGEVVVENRRLQELSGALAQIIKRFEAMKLQRILFRRGLDPGELVSFLQILLPLLKKPVGGDLILAKNQERLPHVIAGALPFETGPQVSYEELSSALKAARRSTLSYTGRIKDLFLGLEGPLAPDKVSGAREITQTLFKALQGGEMPIKVLLYRRSPDPDPYLHAMNVSSISMALAQRIDLDANAIQDIGLAALLHDIGLFLSPEASFSKTATISLDEKKRQWEHPIRGAEILLATPGLPDIAPLVAYEHHLHYDGEGGYPEQKRPRDLNLASLITGIANSYDNLRRNRVGHQALSLTQALNHMDRSMGVDYHPLLYRQFRAMVKAQAEEQV